MLDDPRKQLETHHPAAWRWALACCGFHREEALEVLQDAYLKVIEGRARFAGASAFRTWLFGVIRNTAREHRRRGWLTRLGVVRADDVTPATAVAEIAADQERRALEASLGELPSRQRELVELVLGQEMSIRDAAAVLGISAGTAARHYDRAKSRLHDLLAERGVTR
jgi:RNA polymerase sigma-70 factor (ECF subfamily)